MLKFETDIIRSGKCISQGTVILADILAGSIQGAYFTATAGEFGGS